MPNRERTNQFLVRRQVLNPKCAIEAAILNRFADVFTGDVLEGCEIGDSARDFENAIVGPGTEIQLRHGHPN